ncbi:MAG: hypothetical protein HUJ67_08060 [Ruminiclostridium sp.]|nr:hypothetical protein [Ruminiclostridium sp.]
MKTAKKFIAIILVITLALPIGITAFAAETENAEEFHYVSLGASASNGYGLRGYLSDDMYQNPILSGAQTGSLTDISGYGKTPAGSYPALVKEYFENKGCTVDHDQLAQSSMRVEELRFLLDEDFATDGYTRWRFYDPDKPSTWWYSNLDTLREEYKQSITEADLITYDMGVNNFGVYLSHNLLGNGTGNDLRYVMEEPYADMFYSAREKLQSRITALGIVDQETLDTLNNFTDTLAYALLGYCTNFDATMEIIRQWNPDASIVVLSVQNTIAGVNVSVNGTKIPLGDLFGIVISIANSYTALYSPYHRDYLYADVSQKGRVTNFGDQLLAYDGDPDTLDQDMKDCMDVYETSLPMYLKFRVAAQIAASDGYETAINAETDPSILAANLSNFVSYCETHCSDLYESTLTNAYDVMATVLQAGFSTNPLPIDGLLSGADMDTLEAELVANLIKLISDVTEANINGNPYSDQDIQDAIDALLYNDDVKAVAAIGIRLSIGNTFFSHPNREGYQELYSAVINAIENKTSGRKAVSDRIYSVVREAYEATASFGLEATYSLIEKFSSAFGLDADTIAYLKQKAPYTDNITKLFVEKAGISDGKDLEIIEQCVEEVENDMAAVQHTLEMVPAKKATPFSTGNIVYYVCSDCGELYADAQGTTALDACDITLPRVTLWAYVKSLLIR